MSEREAMIQAISTALYEADNFVPRWAVEKAADAVLALRPADDEGLVEMALGPMRDAFWKASAGDEWRAALRAALSVYRAHDPLLRKAREALMSTEAQVCCECPSQNYSKDHENGCFEPLVRAVLRKLEGAP